MASLEVAFASVFMDDVLAALPAYSKAPPHGISISKTSKDTLSVNQSGKAILEATFLMKSDLVAIDVHLVDRNGTDFKRLYDLIPGPFDAKRAARLFRVALAMVMG